jgi:RNA polymerase sigma factor (sigma-70 family)
VTERQQCGRQQAVGQLLTRLTPRERLIVAGRFGLVEGERPRTFRELAEEFHLSRERVRVIAHRALERLRIEAERLQLDAAELT